MPLKDDPERVPDDGLLAEIDVPLKDCCQRLRQLGVESGSLATPFKVKSLKLEELLFLILAELRMMNYAFRETNPKIIADTTDGLGEYSSFMEDATG